MHLGRKLAELADMRRFKFGTIMSLSLWSSLAFPPQHTVKYHSFTAVASQEHLAIPLHKKGTSTPASCAEPKIDDHRKAQ